MAKGTDLREALKKLGLKPSEIKKAMGDLRGGGDFKSFKDILKGFGYSELGFLKPTVNTYLDALSGGETPTPPPTPTPTPTPVVGPTLPTITPTPSPIEELFPGTGEYEPEPVVGPVMPTITPTLTPTTPTTTDDLKPGEIFRNLLKDLGLNPTEKRKVLEILKAGGRFKDIKGILEEFGVENVGSLKDPVKSYVDFLDIDTPYVAPGTQTYTDEELADLFDSTGPVISPTGPYHPDLSPGPEQPTPTPTIPTIADILGEIEFPEYEAPDFAGFLADFEAQQAASEEKARLRRLTEMSNMAQGSQIAEFRPSAISQNRGGTTPFKRRSGGGPSLRINPRVNTSLSIGARSQLPGVGYTSNNFGGVPGIMSRKAGSLTRRL